MQAAEVAKADVARPSASPWPARLDWPEDASWLLLVLFMSAHALLAVRRMPAGWRENVAIRPTVRETRHGDTPLWQVTGDTLVVLFAVELHGGIGLYRLARQIAWLRRAMARGGRR